MYYSLSIEGFSARRRDEIGGEALHGVASSRRECVRHSGTSLDIFFEIDGAADWMCARSSMTCAPGQLSVRNCEGEVEGGAG